jgi:glycosyltransferase involved in cell wall biosynthesis
MRIALDARPLCHRADGISNFLRGILGAISAADKRNHYFLYAHRKFDWNGVPSFQHETRLGNGGFGTAWLQTQVPFWLRRDRIELFWGTQSVLPLAPGRRVRMVLTLHDMVYRRVPETMKMVNLWINRCFIGPSLRRADRIAADSAWTAKDAVELEGIPPGKIRVVYPSLSGEYRPVDKQAARKSVRDYLGLNEPYVLTVGTLEPRKNLVGALAAHTEMSKRWPHVLYAVGAPGWKMAPLVKASTWLHAGQRVRWLGRVSQELMPALYAAADIFLFPSLYEGFGLPPLEAMACGTPVVASNASCLPEVLGDAALLRDARDTQGLAEAMGRILGDQELRKDLVRKGLERAARYRWDTAAAQMTQMFQEAVH